MTWPKPYQPPVSMLVRIAVPVVVFGIGLLGIIIGGFIGGYGPIAVLDAPGVETVASIVLGFLGIGVGMVLGERVGRRVASRLFDITELDVDRLMPDA